MRTILLPLVAITLLGAGEPAHVEPQHDKASAGSPVPSNETPHLAKPKFLEVTPFRDEINDPSREMSHQAWSEIGGEGDVIAKNRSLLSRLAKARPGDRQKARWDYARFLIHTGRSIEGAAVLDAMAEDEPLLLENAAYQGVRGVALSLAGKTADAAAALSIQPLMDNPEACLWRSYLHAKDFNWRAALINWPCAVDAANRVPASERLMFALPIVRASYFTGRDEFGAQLLSKLKADHPEVMFWKGMFAFRRGEIDLGTKLLSKVRDRGVGPLATRAELELVKALHAAKKTNTHEALKRLDKLRFRWRGTPFERDLLITMSAYEEEDGNLRGALAYAAPLARYRHLGAMNSQTIRRSQDLLMRALDPGSPLDLSAQAAIYWDYRDLAPQGFDGDQVIRNLASKIASAGLTKRAADLLERQIRDRLDDAAPAVAVQAARWRLLAGEPEKALKILEDTNDGVMAPDLRRDRHLMYLYSLLALGRGAEAMAMLDGNHEGLSTQVRAELYWQGKEWRKYAALNKGLIAGRSGFDDTTRGMVIRQAIAASILKDTDELARLNRQYATHFEAKNSPMGPAFQMLTSDKRISEAEIKAALSDIDKAAPADPVLGWISAMNFAQAKPGATKKGA